MSHSLAPIEISRKGDAGTYGRSNQSELKKGMISHKHLAKRHFTFRYGNDSTRIIIMSWNFVNSELRLMEFTAFAHMLNSHGFW